MGEDEEAVERGGKSRARGRKVKILILGDFMIDAYHYATTERISPEAPIPVFKIIQRPKLFDGGAGNVAKNVMALGGDTVVPNYLSSGAYPPRKNRLMVGNTQVVRWDEDDLQQPNDVEIFTTPGISKIIIADYGKGSIDSNVQVAAYEANLPTFVDTKLDPSPYLGWVTAIFPNAKEYQQFKTIYDRFERCVVTRGAEGLEVLEFGKVIESFPAFCPRPVNVCGAGDTVTAAYAVRWPKADAAEFAALAAAIVVAKEGTATASLEEINELRRAVRKQGVR